MTASTEPRGGLDLGWSSGEDGWGDAMNANLLRLSRLGFHPSVLSATTTAPPGSPISGSGYIIPSGATGAWAGKTGQVAVWDGAAWAYAVPRDGWTMHVDGAGLTTYYNGIWSQANVVTASGIGAGTSSLALGETLATAYRGDRGKDAYDHSQATGNPHGTTAAQVGAAEADHEHSADDVTSGILPTSRGGTGNDDLPSGFLISTNQYVQSMGLSDNTIPFYGGISQGF